VRRILCVLFNNPQLWIRNPQIWSKGRIADVLVSSHNMSTVFRRYFPVSYQAWIDTKPSNLYAEYEPLACLNCGKDLLAPGAPGVIVWAYRDREAPHSYRHHFYRVYAACKGNCDQAILRKLGRSEKTHAQTVWQDVSDLKIPGNFLERIMASLNRLREGSDIYTDEAFKQEKNIILILGQVVLRSMTEQEIERVSELFGLRKDMGLA
jgi:hypothetical protein